MHKDDIRKELAIHYFGVDNKKNRDFGKRMINSFLYGRRTTNKTCLIEAGIDPQTEHAAIILDFSRVMDHIAPKLVTKADLDAAEDRFIRERKLLLRHKLLYSALSDLCNRVEAQKLSCALDRLDNEWGFDTQSAVIMHDGAMIPTLHPLPTHRAARENRDTVDTEVLHDITCHVRRTLNVYAKFTVKTGIDTADTVCGVPWPFDDLDSLTEEPEKYQNALRLKRPTDLHTKRAPSATKHTSGVSFTGNTVEIRPKKKTQGDPYAIISLWQFAALHDCYTGPPIAFGHHASSILKRSLSTGSTFHTEHSAPHWALGFTHPELQITLGEIFNTATVCTPTCIPFNMNKTTAPLNPPRPPIFATPPEYPGTAQLWKGASFNEITSPRPWASTSGRPTSAMIGVHRHGHYIIPAVESKHTLSALETGLPSILIVESKPWSPEDPGGITTPPKSTDPRVTCERFAGIPALRIPW